MNQMNQMTTVNTSTNNVMSIDFSKMEESELNFYKEAIQQESLSRMETQIFNLVNNDKKQDEMIKIQNERLTKQEKLTNVIGFGVHSKKFKTFKKVCASRVYGLLGSSASVNFILWQSYFFKRVYADIATHFGVDTCKNINVDNYEAAKEMGSNWIPADWYIKAKLEEMKSKRDMGQLKPERCMALTLYLQDTNDGKINPFV